MIIGISGVARSGKDTLAKMFFNEVGYYRRSFAMNLKDAATNIFGFNEDQVNGPLKEEVDPYWGFTPRWALQFLGTDLCREQLDNDIWVRSTLREVDMNQPFSNLWVLSDVRFRNEAMAIHRRGGIVVRIERDGVGASGGIDGHASEDLSDVPYNLVVPNNGEIKDLRKWVFSINDMMWDFYQLLVHVVADHVKEGGTLKDFEIPLLTTDYFTEYNEDYVNELNARKLTLGAVNDPKFINEVESEIASPTETSVVRSPYT